MLFKLLTLPVSAPLDALNWVADKLAEAAEDKIHDPEALRRELEAAEARLEGGELSEAEYEEIENGLIARLREAHAHMAAKERKA